MWDEFKSKAYELATSKVGIIIMGVAGVGAAKYFNLLC